MLYNSMARISTDDFNALCIDYPDFKEALKKNIR